MTIRTVEEFIDLLDRNNFSIEELCIDKIGIDWDYEAKSFKELGFDGLDIVTMIMEIELYLKCDIRDECSELIELMNPNDLTRRARRQKRLDELGI